MPETEPDQGGKGAVRDGGHDTDAHHERRFRRTVGAEEAHRDEFLAHHGELLEIFRLFGISDGLIDNAERIMEEIGRNQEKHFMSSQSLG